MGMFYIWQARIQEFSSEGVQPTGKIWQAKTKEEGGRFSVYSA